MPASLPTPARQPRPDAEGIQQARKETKGAPFKEVKLTQS